MIDRDEIKNRVKAATDLAEWIRRDGVPLTGGPNDFKAKCPFHEDGTPSFTVFRKENGWAFHCFGCSASGDIFEWVMRRKGVAFPEALKLVANVGGITLPASNHEHALYQPSAVKAAAEKPRGAFDLDLYRPLVPGGKAFEYLTKKRLLPAALLKDYSVAETKAGEAYAFGYKWRPPYWKADCEPACFEFCKVVKVDRPDGKKIEWRDSAGGKNILFGMESSMVKKALAEGGELVICEGELDAVTWATQHDSEGSLGMAEGNKCSSVVKAGLEKRMVKSPLNLFWVGLHLSNARVYILHEL